MTVPADQEKAITVPESDATSHVPPQHGQLMPEWWLLGNDATPKIKERKHLLC
jgi:hypothetical protein